MRFFYFLVLRPADRLETGEGKICFPGGVPARGRSLLQALCRVGHGGKGGAVGRLHLGALGHLPQGPAQTATPKLRPLAQVGQEQLAKGGARQRIGHSLPKSSGLLQPLQGMRLALELFIQLQNQPREAAVIPPRAQSLSQEGGVFVSLLQRLIKPVHDPVQHAAAQRSSLLLVQQAVIRCEAASVHRRQQMDVLPQQAAAEGVHGLDVRLIDPEQLAAQMVVFRLLGHAL